MTLLLRVSCIHNHQVVYINIFKSKIPEEQEHAPRLEPTAPIRLADRNHAHNPSRRRTILKKKDGSMTEDVTRTLDSPPSKVRSDIFPHSLKGNQSDG